MEDIQLFRYNVIVLLQIGVVGDYNPASLSHQATVEAIQHAASFAEVKAQATWLPTNTLAQRVEKTAGKFDALWCAPGSPLVSMSGALNAIRFARENNIPFIGTCGGFQHAVIEYARNVLGFADAQHAEYDARASRLLISPLSCSLAGREMQVNLVASTRTADIYGQSQVQEQYYCSFGLNPEYQVLLHNSGLRVAGVGSEGEARVVELPRHKFFLATLFVPQRASTQQNPHPLIIAYLRAASD